MLNPEVHSMVAEALREHGGDFELATVTLKEKLDGELLEETLVSLDSFKSAYESKSTQRSFKERYYIVRELGRGAEGVVYLARERQSKTLRAVKLLPCRDNPGFGHTCAALMEAGQHESVVQVIDHYQTSNHYEVVMKYAEGEPLSRITKGDEFSLWRRLDPKSRVEVFLDIVKGVEWAHRHDIVHCDLKCSNIIFDPKTRKVSIVDFGLAKKQSENPETRLADTEPVGTLYYMAPEIVNFRLHKDHSKHSDQYSLGVILYTMLSGSEPFVGARDRVIEQIIRDEPIVKSQWGWDNDLRTIVLRCLEKRPTNRFESVKVLREDLEAYLDNRMIKARPPTLLQFGRRLARRPFLYLFFAFSFLAFTSLLVFSLFINDANRKIRAEQKVNKEQNERLKLSNTELNNEKERLRLSNYLNNINLRYSRFRSNGEAFNSERLGMSNVSDEFKKFQSFEYHFFERKLAAAPRTIGEYLSDCTGVIPSKSGQAVLAGSSISGLFEWGFSGWNQREISLPNGKSVRAISANSDRSRIAILHGKIREPANFVTVLNEHYEVVVHIQSDRTIEGVTISDDGKQLFLPCSDGFIEIIEVDSGEKTMIAVSKKPIFSIAQLNDETLAITGQRLLIFDHEKRIVLGELDLTNLRKRGLISSRHVEFASDEKRLYASAFGARPSTVGKREAYGALLVIDVKNDTLELVTTIEFERPIESIAVSPDYSTVLVGTDGLHKVSTNELSKAGKITEETPYCIFPFEDKVLCGMRSGRFQVASVEMGGGSIEKIPASRPRTAFAISPDDRFLLVANGDVKWADSLMIWDLKKGLIAKNYDVKGFDAQKVGFNRSGDRVFATGAQRSIHNGESSPRVVVWDCSGKDQNPSFDSLLTLPIATFWGSDSHLLYATSADTLTCHDLEKNRQSEASFDGSIVLVGADDKVVFCVTQSAPEEFKLHKLVRSGNEVSKQLISNNDLIITKPPISIAVSQTNGIVALGYKDGSIDVINFKEPGKIARVSFEFPGDVTDLKFSNDGHCLAATLFAPLSANTGRLAIWDTKLWELRASYDRYSGNPTAVSFSNDSQSLIANSDQRELAIWNPPTDFPPINSRFVLRQNRVPRVEIESATLKRNGVSGASAKYDLTVILKNGSQAEINTRDLVVQTYRISDDDGNRSPTGGAVVDNAVVSHGRAFRFTMKYVHRFQAPTENFSKFVIDVYYNDRLLDTKTISVSH